jgi:hypothetical protein
VRKIPGFRAPERGGIKLPILDVRATFTVELLYYLSSLIEMAGIMGGVSISAKQGNNRIKMAFYLPIVSISKSIPKLYWYTTLESHI